VPGPIVGRLRKAGLTLVFLLILAAPAQAALPDDPGSTGKPGGWQQDQWNFLPGTGVDAPLAWSNLIAAGRAGGLGVKVAVLDTGLAYENRGRHRRSPDISRFRLAPGRDFCPRAGSGLDPCAGQDAHPDDDNGHGTHVASTIGEATANGIGETGLAYGVTLMPVRVLDRFGSGDEESISAGIEWAARHGAQVINLSFEFGTTVKRADEVPQIARAVRDARRRGAIVVAAAGNSAAPTVAYPAALPGVVSVGAVTADGCLADYSDSGPGLDLVAPGGGQDAGLDQPGCFPKRPGRPILQMTFTRKDKSFHLPTSFDGTSMATPHVSATAALVIASGVLGPKPSPGAIERRLMATARDLGAPGRDSIYGSGMVDAGAATSPF
jgi:serine protease